jgi:hypothetical protein
MGIEMSIYDSFVSLKESLIQIVKSDIRSFKTEKEYKNYFGISTKKALNEIHTFEKLKVNTNIQRFAIISRKENVLNDIFYFVNSELTLLEDFFPDFSLRFNYQDQCKLIFNSLRIPKLKFISYIKYHTACPMATYLKNSLPPHPLPDIKELQSFWLWTGNVKQFLKNKLNSNFGYALAVGYLQGIKRGCATVPDFFVKQEIESHKIAMAKEPENPPYRIHKYTKVVVDQCDLEYSMDRYGNYSPPRFDIKDTRVVDPLEVAFLSTIDSIISSRYSVKVVDKVYEPSHNSCFTKKKWEGGQYMQVVETMELPLVSTPVIRKGKVEIVEHYQPPNNFKDIIIPEKVKYMAEKVILKEENDFKDILNKFYDEGLIDLPERLVKEDITTYKPLNINYSITPKVAVIPIREPLKVRIITKADAMRTYASKPLQKRIKNYIDRFFCFILTTRPLTINDFYILDQKLLKLGNKYEIDFIKLFNKRVSGDYKAATDNLNIRFTKLIFERLCRVLNVDESEMDIYRSILYESVCFYPDGSTIMQKNGQLMGSILSFPILCLANMICYKRALEEYIFIKTNKKVIVSPHDIPALINGDDIYFRTNDEFYEIWFKYISLAGFKLSVGKNYVHTKHFTINSQYFTVVGDSIVETTFLNVGLLMGQAKVSGNSSVLPEWDIFNKVIKGAFNKERTINRYLFYHSKNLHSASSKSLYNYFLPLELGGLGLKIPEDVNYDVKITDFQKHLANYLSYLHKKSFQKKLLSTDLESIRMVNINAPPTLDEYQGERSTIIVPLIGPLPQDFVKKSELPSDNSLFVSTTATHFDSEVKYRGFSTKFLNDVKSYVNLRRKKGLFRPGELFFDEKTAVHGDIPYHLVYSSKPDVNSQSENYFQVADTLYYHNFYKNFFLGDF